MAYKFGVDEPVREAIVRAAREQLDRAVTELSESINEDPVGAVHSARKAIKKERSLLRLARGTISARERRRENRALRDAARALSGTRDADVMLASLDQLSERFAGQLPAATFDAIREALTSRRSAANGGRGAGAVDGEAVAEIGTVRLRVDDWTLSRGGWKALEAGLMRSYKQGRRALDRVRSSGRTDDSHEWRKRVKDLWYQERLLGPTCGAAVRGHAKELHRLADLLGDDHDLAVLGHELERDVTIAADVDAVIKLIEHRRAQLKTEAIGLGERCYVEKPSAYRVRMKRSWKAGRALARAEQAQQDPTSLAAATREPR